MDDSTVDRGPRVVSVRLRSSGNTVDFDPGALALRADDAVLVESSHGPEVGTVVASPLHRAARHLPRVLKKADPRDMARDDGARLRDQGVFRSAVELVRSRRLDLKLVKADTAVDGSKVTVFYTSDDKLELRELALQLGILIGIRVEMKHVGARDESKVTGGVGVCGRELCCSSWLRDFKTVTVKMAKEQGLAVNPAKLAGQCGRLKCCLRYEYATYQELRRSLPAVGKPVESVKGDGVVVRQNLLRQTVVIRRSDDETEVEATLDDLVAKKGDA